VGGVSARQIESAGAAEARRHSELLDLISVRLPKLDPARARAAALMLGWSNALAEQAVTFDEYLSLVSGPEAPPSFPLAA
jgi:hypothetical protein